jgi:hypothetical protein
MRRSPELSYRPNVPPAIASRRVFNYARTGVNSPERPMRTDFLNYSISETKEKARIGPQQIESNESSPCFRSSADANNIGASVPPLRAGHEEMKARVDIYQGYADPPCVSALLCRCSRAEHLIDARQWVKESNLRVSPGSHQKCGCDWSEYSRHPWRCRSSAALFAPRRHRSAAGYRRNPSRSRDTAIRGRRVWLRFADRDSYAIGLASGASWVPR